MGNRRLTRFLNALNSRFGWRWRETKGLKRCGELQIRGLYRVAKEKRDVMVHIRVSARELAEVKRTAENAGYASVSQYMRKCALDRLQVESWKQARREELAKKAKELGLD